MAYYGILWHIMGYGGAVMGENVEIDRDQNLISEGVSQVAPVVKNPPARAGDTRLMGSIPGLGRSPGGGSGNPLHFSCLESPMDREAWWTAAHGIIKSCTWLKWLTTHHINFMLKAVEGPFWARECFFRLVLFSIKRCVTFSSERGQSTCGSFWWSSWW